MARGVNKVTLMGYLGQDPEVRYSAGGDAIASMSLATSESWKDKNTGQRQERTEWHRCVAFKRLAEIVGEYAQKGALVYCEGKLVTRKWVDSGGIDRYTTEVVLDVFQIVDGGRKSDEKPAQKADARHNHNGTQKSYSAPPPPPSYDSFDDDIPF